MFPGGRAVAAIVVAAAGRISATKAESQATPACQACRASQPARRRQLALIRVVERVLKLYKIAKVETPIVVMATLVGVKGATIALKFLAHPHQSYDPIDRDMLVIPEVILESLDEDVVSALRPIFDTIWNAAGWEGCAFYDDSGRLTAEAQAYLDSRPYY